MAYRKLKTKNMLIILMLIVFLVWLVIFDPTKSHPFELLVPFVIIFILLFSVFEWLLRELGVMTNKGQRRGVSWLVSFITTAGLVLSSLGQLSLANCGMLTAIMVIGAVYIVKLMPVEK